MWSGESERVIHTWQSRDHQSFLLFFYTVLRCLQASAGVWELSRSAVMWILCESDTTVSDEEGVQEQFCALVHCRERRLIVSAVLRGCDDFLFLTAYFHFTQYQRIGAAERRTWEKDVWSRWDLFSTVLSQSSFRAQMTEINRGVCSPLFCVSKGANETFALFVLLVNFHLWSPWLCLTPQTSCSSYPALPTLYTARQHSPACAYVSLCV